MGNLRPFQIALLALFGAMALGALILLGAYQAKVSQESKVYGDSVVIWGTFPQQPIEALFKEVVDEIEAFQVVTYRQFSKETFTDDLVNAIAEGRSPDMIILPSDTLVELRPKLLPLSYEVLPLRTIKDTYIDGAEIFTFPEGVYAVPFAVDPLMLYWNRDVFAANGLAVPPATWEDVINLVVPNVTEVDNRRTILQSAVAFGEYRNLLNPKAILMTLAMQSGSRMVYLSENRYAVEIDRHVTVESKEKPLQTAMEFFTDFSNSNSQLYTWNRVQPDDKNAFLSGELAMYFGMASEYSDIERKNPNLNFDIALMPQGSTATIKRTYADIYGYAIPLTSPNPEGAYQVALTLSSPAYAPNLAERLGMVAVRRDVIAVGALDPVTQVILNAALVARSWLDPDVAETDIIFQDMVESVVSNRERINNAVERAVTRIAREF